jgi:GntR family transcriptional regulator
MTSMVSLMIMDRLEIDRHAPEPSYRQLAAQLRARIESGQIPPREALPSITYLVQETGLAVGTVRKAIALLVQEGYAYTVPGRGTFAAQQDGWRLP